MPNAIGKQKLIMKQPRFSENSERGKRVEAWSKKMGDAENLSVSSLSIADGITEAGAGISALDKIQKYILKTKASLNKQQEADSVSFT